VPISPLRRKKKMATHDSGTALASPFQEIHKRDRKRNRKAMRLAKGINRASLTGLCQSAVSEPHNAETGGWKNSTSKRKDFKDRACTRKAKDAQARQNGTVAKQKSVFASPRKKNHTQPAQQAGTGKDDVSLRNSACGVKPKNKGKK